MTKEALMIEAIKEARLALDEGNWPIGCVIELDGKIIARGHNRVYSAKDRFGHAEMLALREANDTLNERPNEATLASIIDIMKKDFVHPALDVQKDKPLIYTAMSKHLFYYRMFISVFVLENGGVPLNPFMVFDYFLLDAVDRNLVREGNNNLVKRCDEIWAFGVISNGMLAEIQIANEQGKTVRYFTIEKPHRIVETTKDNIEMEAEVANMHHML